MLSEFLRLGLRNEVRSRKVGEGYLPCLSVERAAPARPVELLKATREQYLRRRLVGDGELLAIGDERFPAPADVGVFAEKTMFVFKLAPCLTAPLFRARRAPPKFNFPNASLSSPWLGGFGSSKLCTIKAAPIAPRITAVARRRLKFLFM